MYRSLTFLGFAPKVAVAILATLVSSVGMLEAAVYQDYVNYLEPNYYFELNETVTTGGVLDSVSGTAIGSYNLFPGGFSQVGVDGPDFLIEGGKWTLNDVWTEYGADVPIVGLGDGNKAFGAFDEGHIDLMGSADRANFGAEAMTVAVFAKSGGNPQGGERIFTNNIASNDTSFQIVVGNAGIVVSVDPSVDCAPGACAHKSLFLPGEGGDGFTGTGSDNGLSNHPENGWWHIVASTEGSTPQERIDNIRLVLNGVDRTADFKPGTTGWGVNDFPAKIGGRRGDPLDSTTYSGEIDELSIWLDRVLTVEEATNLYLAATDATFEVPVGPVCGAGDPDLNCDGNVDGLDLGILLGAWDPAVAAAMGIGQGAVPEPTSFSLLALAGTGLLAIRRRRS